MNFGELERRVVVASELLPLAAVVGSLAGSLLMFVLGIYSVFAAFYYGLSEVSAQPELFGLGAIIDIIESLERFLIGLVLLYFSYGVYALFIHADQNAECRALPPWLRVTRIGQLKQVVAELIVVILYVVFLRRTLKLFGGALPEFSWAQIATLAVLPACALMLAYALKLLELHPKPRRTEVGAKHQADALVANARK